MATYQIALDNTGLESVFLFFCMAELMAERGYDVKAVHHCSSWNEGGSCPCSDDEWLELLELASAK